MMSKRYWLAFVVVSISLTGCTHTMNVDLEDDPSSARNSGSDDEADQTNGEHAEYVGRLDPELLTVLIREAEYIRELEAIEHFDAYVVNSEQIRRLIREEAEDIDMGDAQYIMEAFGFIPPGTDLEALLLDLYTQETAGMYDPEQNRLMVLERFQEQLRRPGLSEDAMEARMVVVHEIVHALQDQHFDTLDSSSDEAWSDDAESVINAVVEGDATLSMMVYTIAKAQLPVDPTTMPGLRQRLRTKGRIALPQSEALSNVPPYFGHIMSSFYLEGAAFIGELRRIGGWKAVDGAHRNPPRGTRDILHTEDYVKATPITDFDIPNRLPGLSGYKRIASERLGELESSAFLLPIGDIDRIFQAAEGWSGDRFAIYQDENGTLALVWRVIFLNENEAREFYDAAHDATIASQRGSCVADPARSADRRAVNCFEGRDRIEQRGPSVVILRNIPSSSSAELAETLFDARTNELTADPPQPSLLGAF